MLQPGSVWVVTDDRQMTWVEFHLGVECEAALAAREGGALAWSYDRNESISIVDEAGSWAYVSVGEGE